MSLDRRTFSKPFSSWITAPGHGAGRASAVRREITSSAGEAAPAAKTEPAAAAPGDERLPTVSLQSEFRRPGALADLRAWPHRGADDGAGCLALRPGGSVAR